MIQLIFFTNDIEFKNLVLWYLGSLKKQCILNYLQIAEWILAKLTFLLSYTVHWHPSICGTIWRSWKFSSCNRLSYLSGFLIQFSSPVLPSNLLTHQEIFLACFKHKIDRFKIHIQTTKIVKNPWLFLNQCTFTMFRPKVRRISQRQNYHLRCQHCSVQNQGVLC